MKKVIFLIFTAFTFSLSGQSFFYNTQQFGLKSTLLGGAVTAGSSDLSMVYYNPAALRYSKDKGFDLALFMPSVSSYNYGDYFNNDQDLKTLDLSLHPSLVTYKTNIKDFELVFAVLQKDIWNNGLEYSNTKKDGSNEKNESFKYRYKGDEKWFGMGANVMLSDVLSIGVSQFWSFLSTTYNYGLSSESLNPNGIQQDFYKENLILEYGSFFAMVTKLGLSFDRPKDRIGIVVTSPNYQSFYKSASYDRSRSSLKSGKVILSNTVDFNLTPDLKNGWQFDIGYAKTLRDSSEIWLNASLHTGVNTYEIFRVESLNSSPLVFTGGRAAIPNFALGYSRNLSPNIQFLSSIRTNLNAFHNVAPLDDSQSLIILEQNRTQVAIGCKVNHKNSSFVIGLDWGFAIDHKADQLDRFPNIDLFERNTPFYEYHSVTLLLTYEFFLDSVGRNISRMLDKPQENNFH